MGQASSKNKTGKKVVKQKLEHAEKTGILSLTEHGLKEVPPAVLALNSLRTLDLSANALKLVPEELCGFVQLKTLKVCARRVRAARLFVVAVVVIVSLSRIQINR